MLAVWIVQLALNVGMMMRVCTCDVAEEKQKDDRTMLIAQRRSRLATPSVTPGGGPGHHTPQLFPPVAQPMGPGQPSQGPPRQYGLPPPARDDRPRTPEMPPEKKLPSDLDVSDVSGGQPAPQHVLPPPQRRMEPSPRRPMDEGPVVVEDTSLPPPAYHQLPPPQARSPPSKLV